MGHSAPIFVVGMNGSGTGVLTRSLAQHSSVYAFPGESRIFLNYMGRFPQPIENLDDAQFRDLLDGISKDTGLTRWNGDQALPIGGAALAEPSLAGALDLAFTYFAAQEGKARWCEKTPGNAHCIESLVAHFPQAKILHVVRDGRDAALSFQRRFGYTPLLSLQRWKTLLLNARSQGAAVGPERYLELRYESLTTTPRETLLPVCEFLDIDFEESMLSPTRPKKSASLAPTFVANSEKWRELVSELEVAEMEGLAGALLAELGYTVTNPRGNARLPAWKRMYFQLADTCRQANRYISDIMSGDRSLTEKLNALLGIAKSSLKAKLFRRQ